MKYCFVILIFFSVTLDVRAQESSMQVAKALLDAGNYDASLEAFNTIEKENKTNPSFYFFRGTCLSEMGLNERAITDLSVSISLDQSNAECYYQRGFSFFSIGNSENAIQDFDQAIVLDPEYGEAYLNRGTINYQLEKLDSACKDWQASLALGIELAKQLLDQLCK
jgi:tetratricopeptide (TPR) repeat protein